MYPAYKMGRDRERRDRENSQQMIAPHWDSSHGQNPHAYTISDALLCLQSLIVLWGNILSSQYKVIQRPIAKHFMELKSLIENLEK